MIKLFLTEPKWLASLVILVLAVLLIGCRAPANQSPLISSLTAGELWVAPAGICQIQCTASDSDGDELGYTWSASGGDISGEGPVVTWAAPVALGAYIITVAVTDGRGGEATEQLTINIVVNQPPVINSLITEWERLRKASASTIECVASDSDDDELSYIWSAERGNISGEGAIVTWIAPSAYGIYAITVTVVDGKGGRACESISIEVCDCPDAG